MSKIYVTSRSAFQSFLISPRLFYFSYCAQGTGITEKIVNHHLAIGTFVHECCGQVMAGSSEADVFKKQSEIFLEEAEDRGIDSEFSPHILLALSQGLAKTWLRARLPQIKKDFEILAVEQERELSIYDDTLQLLLPVRIDAEIKCKYTGKHSALEMKTVSSLWPSTFAKYQFDIQPLLHTWAVQHVWGDCENVMMEFLYKGYPAAKPNKNRLLLWNSVFTKGYEKLGVPPFTTSKTEYTCVYAIGRKVGWEAINVPDKFTQDEWHKLVGKDLDGVVSFKKIVRDTEVELPEFQHQLFEAHKRIVEGLGKLEVTTDPTERRAILNIYFPLAWHPYDKHLIGLNPDDENLLESGDWIRREPHHPLEKEVKNQLT